MRDTTIAGNYGETLFALAGKADDLQGWAAMIGEVADAMAQNATLRLFLESPRVSAARKNELLGAALSEDTPRVFLRFLQSMVTHRRQMLIPEVAREYRTLVDEAEGRLHANVTVARQPPEEEKPAIPAQLPRALGKEAAPHLTLDPPITGTAPVPAHHP